MQYMSDCCNTSLHLQTSFFCVCFFPLKVFTYSSVHFLALHILGGATVEGATWGHKALVGNVPL